MRSVSLLDQPSGGCSGRGGRAKQGWSIQFDIESGWSSALALLAVEGSKPDEEPERNPQPDLVEVLVRVRFGFLLHLGFGFASGLPSSFRL